jgi:hypothetical protein
MKRDPCQYSSIFWFIKTLFKKRQKEKGKLLKEEGNKITFLVSESILLFFTEIVGGKQKSNIHQACDKYDINISLSIVFFFYPAMSK